MSEQRDRVRKSLADDLKKAVKAQLLQDDTATERWVLVAERIDLLIDAALLERDRASEGKPGSDSK